MSVNFPHDQEAETEEIFADPQPGDRLHEMLHFWVYVVYRDGDTIATMEASAPCTFPQDGRVRVMTIDEFRQYFAYKSMPGYWVRAAGRGHSVAGWYDANPKSNLAAQDS